MEAGPAKARRAPRSDSLRNRERLISAAREVFAEGGPGASLEAVARRAELGIGTLYRHFPTRESLFHAVYAKEIDELVALATRFLAEPDPLEGLRCWMRANIRVIATKRGMLVALTPAPDRSRALYDDSRRRLLEAAGALMRRAGEAAAIRPDVTPEELLWALHGIAYGRDEPGWQVTALRLVDIFVDGLRTRP
ncbi:TetR/AcrR family transcriptional regulator [Amaricoccus solimangrovi]|uniref:TetR/AcrR family transcriptional regulator n=2 Tax=Amaricoccus solimangrovi TaxID=2589815 RepID=A0A501WRZ0_9RHOB|nr:TetR/AcrR family transcriptional regulator [Amaricoccus solimangrovi]